ncbi:MAG: GMC family oxidoreductase [Saprospiraceae bacterium]
MKKYEIIIIGTGAGGGTLAHKLAGTGKQILILERGNFLPKEVENWNPHEVYTVGRYRPKEEWLDKEGNPFPPFTHYCVGGNTKVYGAALLRLRESDFTEVKHAEGTSPAWPIPYSTWESYYSKAEKMYSAHGTRGIDPTEPYSAAPYPFPALTPEPDMKELYEHIEMVGHRPAPIPIGVRLNQDSRIVNDAAVLSLFDGYPDPTDMKADSHVVGIKPVLAHDNVKLMTGMKAVKLVTDSTGKKVTKVVAENNGHTMEFEGDLVVVSCGAINSAALLLRSANARHPNGLGNSSGLVGRNLMLHNNGTVVAVTGKPNNAVFQKSFLLSEFYHGTDDFPFPLGSIQLMGKTDPDTLQGLLEEEFGKDKNYDLDYYARHTIDFFITTEDLPSYENRVKVKPDGTLQLVYQQNNLEAYNRLRQKLIGILDEVGRRFGYGIKGYLGYKLGVSGVSHQTGTCRFGQDPMNSVLDLNCKAHDLDNLYVVDTSFFPSSGAVNPSLTAMANALRVGDHLIQKMGSAKKMEKGSTVAV